MKILKNNILFIKGLQTKKQSASRLIDRLTMPCSKLQEQVKVSENQVAQVKVDIERSTIRAPVEGVILQVNAHIGEIYAPVSYNITESYLNLQTAQILMGTVSPLQMRIDIDEEDCWRFLKALPPLPLSEETPTSNSL